MSLKIIKINDNLNDFKDIFEVTDSSILYVLRLDGNTVGYSKINLDQETDNRFEMFIFEEHRGNGYGKYLFGEMLKEIKSLGYKEINLQIKRNNLIARKLIEFAGGLKLSQKKDIITFVLPIN